MAHVFTRYLKLEVPVRTSDGAGGQAVTWEQRGGLWAEVRMRSGSLRHGDFGRTPRLQVRMRTHALPEGSSMRPEPGHRLRDGAHVYEVEAAHCDDAHVLTILASETPGAGGTA
ncbi:Phage head-tail joining protein [Jannaschia faecimaris]|uniref:Phage head-tail joining protein n=1 Tax=Jannaschia faecimaris TaxID=1244108 RepID=A0A1H3RYK4_9RHOB|nr:head-tail adaptor protein [Jannaschia faecimaris]SDZ30754.1 Phage head-tail joining protein [Jannaschia faecimaris]